MAIILTYILLLHITASVALWSYLKFQMVIDIRYSMECCHYWSRDVWRKDEAVPLLVVSISASYPL